MKSITALICITLLIAYALYQGIDGVLLTAAIGMMAGLGGYFAPHKKPPP